MWWGSTSNDNLWNNSLMAKGAVSQCHSKIYIPTKNYKFSNYGSYVFRSVIFIRSSSRLITLEYCCGKKGQIACQAMNMWSSSCWNRLFVIVCWQCNLTWCVFHQWSAKSLLKNLPNCRHTSMKIFSDSQMILKALEAHQCNLELTCNWRLITHR